MHRIAMLRNKDSHASENRREQLLLAAGSVMGALAASSCCMLPLVLFSLGVSGAWVGSLTRLAPYQPPVVASTIACLGYGYWLVYSPSKGPCANGETCAQPMPNRLVKLGLIVATVVRADLSASATWFSV